MLRTNVYKPPMLLDMSKNFDITNSLTRVKPIIPSIYNTLSMAKSYNIPGISNMHQQLQMYISYHTPKRQIQLKKNRPSQKYFELKSKTTFLYVLASSSEMGMSKAEIIFSQGKRRSSSKLIHL